MGVLGSFLGETTNSNTDDPELQAVIDFEAAARALDLEAWIVERLRHPENETTHNLLLTRDSGEASSVALIHVEHACLPHGCGGTIAFTPEISVEQLRASAMRATWQAAILGLDSGGSATAVRCDPRNLSERELRRLMREISGISLPTPTVISPGFNGDAVLMGWLFSDQFRCNVRFTGKPEALGGFDHDELAAFALTQFIERHLQRYGRGIAGLRIAIQGTGRLCLPFAAAVHRMGAHIVGVADISGAVLDGLGLDPGALREHLRSEGVLLGYSNAEAASNEDLLEYPCDVLVLAAGEKQVHAENQNRIKAGIVVEVTPGAVSREFIAKLSAREIVVIPELLVTGGYAIAREMEGAERGVVPFSSSRRKAMVRRSIRIAEARLHEVAQKWGVDYSRAALLLGVKRVAAGLRAGSS